MHNKKNTIITLAILISILLTLAFGLYYFQQNRVHSERDADATQALVVSEETPYTDLHGNPFSFEQFKGHVRVVNTWASWCPFCSTELRDFETLADEYAAQNVVVIAVNRKEPKERARAFLDHIGTFTHIHFAVDLTDAFYRSVGGFAMPETVFYDAQGNIVSHTRGSMTLTQMREHTEAALTAREK